MSDDTMMLFHGSSLPVEAPRVIEGAYAKDFGNGFYLTLLQEQAEKWAMRKYRNMFRSDNAVRPVVSVYRFERGRASESCPSLLFPAMSDEWLDFIAACRAGKAHDYAYVEGPMADDKVYNYVESFLSGSIDRDEFLSLIHISEPTRPY